MVGVRFGTGSVINGVPPSGSQVFVEVGLNAPAPAVGGVPFDVSYTIQGNYTAASVNGPSHITSVPGGTGASFPMTVAPCAAAPCSVIVTVGGVKSGPLQVNP